MPITITDLRRELEDLKRSIAEDNDKSGRDHLPNGRWPMIHNLASLIDDLCAANLSRALADARASVRKKE